MTLIVSNNGETIALSLLVNKVSVTENLVYRLFTNNITPAHTDTAGTYTEAVGGGYASKTLTGATWGMSGGAPEVAAYPLQTWTFTGPLTTNFTIYGYYVTRVSTGDLVYAEAFSNFVPTNVGDQILLVPQISAL